MLTVKKLTISEAKRSIELLPWVVSGLITSRTDRHCASTPAASERPLTSAALPALPALAVTDSDAFTGKKRAVSGRGYTAREVKIYVPTAVTMGFRDAVVPLSTA